ncbi:MAG: transglycosylase [Ferruginibacter sp.]|nr:transglycosylase [Ferruginibacter sp.]
MGILSWIVFGLIAGAIAKWLHKGDDPGGWIVTIVIGIVGAFVGGLIGKYLLKFDDASGWTFHSFICAIIGAFLVLVVYRMVTKNRSNV